MRLVSDNGEQVTSVSFVNYISILGIEQISKSCKNPNGNADTDRLMLTIEEEVIG